MRRRGVTSGLLEVSAAFCLLLSGAASVPGQELPPPFRRGDSNADGAVNITDGIRILDFLFLGGAPFSCMDAADANDSGTINLTDPVHIFNFLFLGGPEPLEPGITCGTDPSADDLGCLEYQPQDCCVPVPVAEFTASTTQGPAPLEVTLEATESSCPGGESLTYQWSFGDGATGSGRQVTHRYEDPGSYEVRLTARNGLGRSAIAVATIEVGGRAPVCRMALPAVADVDAVVTFDGSGSFAEDPRTEIVAYLWIFGDGFGAPGAIATHAYSEVGEYRVSLIVTDDRGLSSQCDRTILINGPPACFASAVPSRVAPGAVVQFEGFGIDPEGGEVEFSWDFGDGGTARGQLAQHAYTQSGQFEAVLTVTDTHGGVCKSSVEITVLPPPPTFTEVFNSVITTFCVGCHRPGDREPLTFTTRNEAYQSLLRTVNGSPVERPSVRCLDQFYVVPGDADASYLIQKLRGTEPARCRAPGDPDHSRFIFADRESNIERIRGWINGGALDN